MSDSWFRNQVQQTQIGAFISRCVQLYIDVVFGVPFTTIKALITQIMSFFSSCCYGDTAASATIEYTQINRTLTDSANHADDEKYQRLLTEENSLKKQSQDLRKEMDGLHATVQSLKTSNIHHQQKSDELLQILNDTQIKHQTLRTKIAHLNSEIETLKESNLVLQQTLNSQVQSLQQELDLCKEKLQTYEAHVYQRNKENEIGNEATTTFAENQITIALDEKARNDSMSFCTDVLTYNNKHGTEKTFSFFTFLDSLIKQNKINSFLNKIDSNSIDAAQLLAVLTLLGAIYTVKCMELQSAGENVRHAVNSNSSAMKQAVKRKVKHLCVYIVRKYGAQKTYDVNINAAFHGFVLNVTKEQFVENIVEWVRSYIDDHGAILVMQ